MNRTGIIRAAALAASVLGLAACDVSNGVDPSVAQHQVAVRSDPDQALADKVKKALEQLHEQCLFLKVLGSYPAAKEKGNE